MKATHFVRIVTSTGALALVAALAACSRPAPAPEPVRAVKLVTVSAGALDASAEYAGEVRAQVESRLGFRVGGKLLERPAELGQRVKPGQLLARIDAQDLALSSQAAQAAVAAARTQRDLARADLDRFKNLQSQGFVSGAEIDRRQATLDAAEASLKQAQAQSSVQGNQAAYARLLADSAGVVTAVQAEVGQVVSAGTPVVVVAQDGPRDVVFAVPEDRLALVRPGTPATVRPWAGTPDAQALKGTVREVAASADATTRTFLVKLALPGNAPLPLGSTAYVTLQTPLSGAQAITLPTSAVQRSSEGDRKGSMVWVFDAASSTVQARPVVVAGADGNRVVIADGLKPGDEVVAAGGHVLSAGQKVTRFAAQ
ncbi:efflux RND transporter periplasmic adaptor subunit [Hydrogenophaga crocea]|uniref:Efflux RND transporter periplasmic adaptor subunit n=1 Tax=Hydrogenophaga crocea TaxID=2716225 RepID=A0A6G8IED5_9BURK|nr:efflux RND transporter periplasmic adaptor subunit [Hydrogenophaga crocea]QIM51564.1 efflux RND transporter periplasmic adaptor subunit [Hydrogenophaga crocea]